MTTWPNCRDGRRLVIHLLICPTGTSKRGEMTPHLLMRPVRLMTILLPRWSSTISNSPMYPGREEEEEGGEGLGCVCVGGGGGG